jgi:hypothetical protein
MRDAGLNLEKENFGVFAPYLLSAIKPDPLYSAAKQLMESEQQLWLSWYNHSALQNRTILSAKALKQRAEVVRARMVENPETILHYICYTTYMYQGTNLSIYRLTYQVAHPYGYADVVLAVEPDGQEVGYL